jgi:hypothetical protein
MIANVKFKEELEAWLEFEEYSKDRHCPFECGPYYPDFCHALFPKIKFDFSNPNDCIECPCNFYEVAEVVKTAKKYLKGEIKI